MGEMKKSGRDDGAIAQDSRSLAARKAYLVAAIAAAAVYGLGDLISGLLYEGYSHRDQAISELTAFGSPVRPLMLTAMMVHGLLLVVFAVGLWRLSRERILHGVAGLFIAAWVVGLPNHTIWAMSSRGMDAGFNDTMHITGTIVWSLLVAAAVVLSAVAYRGRFRIYAIATLVILAGFGAAASFAMAGLEQDMTPWAGAFERINAYAYFAWVIVLAVTWERHHAGAARAQPRTTGPGRTMAPAPAGSR